MLFSTDKQTLDDLNIFARHGDSIYSLFNRCVTRGGAAILEDMFRHPLSDEEAINRRSGIISYFSLVGMAFPFNGSLFDAIEPYLANTDERTKLVPVKRISSLLVKDTETEIIHKGIKAVTQLLQQLQQFIDLLTNAYYYQPGIDSVNNLLDQLELDTVDDLPGYDTLFRFRQRDTLQKLLRHVYHLDVYISVAALAREKGFVFPKALPRHQGTVDIAGLYHPQVAHAVPNSVRIAADGNVIFLTGANMAGKSTFMKSLSIALFLAHMGFPVAASGMEFAVFDGIFTTINLPDNLGIGASHFYAEVLRVKKIAYELKHNRRLLVVFDELFRGTNVKDAYEATVAVTAAFAQKTNSLFLISTHIIEAGEVLQQRCANMRCWFLPTVMQNGVPVYTYTLAEGITNDRHGMVIINNEGILKILEANEFPG